MPPSSTGGESVGLNCPSGCTTSRRSWTRWARSRTAGARSKKSTVDLSGSRPASGNQITHEGRSQTESQWGEGAGDHPTALNLRLKKHGPSKALDAAELQKSKPSRAPARPVTIRRLGFSGKSTDFSLKARPRQSPVGGSPAEELNDKLVAAVRSGRDPAEVAQAFGVTKAQVLQAVADQQESKLRRSPDRPTVVIRRLGFSGQSNTSVSRRNRESGTFEMRFDWTVAALSCQFEPVPLSGFPAGHNVVVGQKSISLPLPR